MFLINCNFLKLIFINFFYCLDPVKKSKVYGVFTDSDMILNTVKYILNPLIDCRSADWSETKSPFNFKFNVRLPLHQSRHAGSRGPASANLNRCDKSNSFEILYMDFTRILQNLTRFNSIFQTFHTWPVTFLKTEFYHKIFLKRQKSRWQLE